MSFKRDGNDSCALNNQRKRRVAELLFEDIADDEVAKLSNGKFTCKLCRRQPVFDTLSMFYVHKKGKHHLASQEAASVEKQELADLIEKRQHELLQSRSEATATSTTIASRTTEDNCRLYGNKKPKVSPFGRKEKVELNTSPDMAAEATSIDTLPGNRGILKQQWKPGETANHRYGNMSSQDHKGDLLPPPSDNNQFKKYFVNRNQPVQCNEGTNSYCDNNITSKVANTAKNHTVHNKVFKSSPQSDNDVVGIKDVQKLVDNSQSNQSKYYMARRKQKEAGGTNNKLQQSDTTSTVPNIYKSWDYYKNLKGPATLSPIVKAQTGQIAVDKRRQACDHSAAKTSPQPTTQPVTEARSDPPSKPSTLQAEKSHIAEKMLNAFGSGWKKDWKGDWVRDEDVEFDSDEEPPDI